VEGMVERLQPPNYFIDLNLDQVIDAITIHKEDYHLKPLFYTPLNAIDAIIYRQQIFQELENAPLIDQMLSFAKKMNEMRQHLKQVDRLSCKYQKESWFLDGVEIYCDAINQLSHHLDETGLKSRGFMALREYLINYRESAAFKELLRETKKLKADLSSIRYSLLIMDDGFKVSPYESESDYSVEVEKTFERFKQCTVKDYRVEFYDHEYLNHIEEKILDFVSDLYPEIFSSLSRYFELNRNFIDEKIRIFDREIQFYISYLKYISKLRAAGLQFCIPKVVSDSKEVYNFEGFDLALAHKLTSESLPIICNDFYLKNEERVIVVSGPNQGGKTTFARTFGQLHYLEKK
jgi:DNA mismatch repair protein MutS